MRVIRQKGNVIYISHGGGPLPLLGDPDHLEMVNTLQVMAGRVGKPSAILVISAHWEADIPTITSGPSPQLIYDYGGFSKEAYEIQYPCSGQPELALSVHQALMSAGIDAKLDDHRGFDHGLFVPLKIMYPQADIPCVQMSLVHSLEPEVHLAIGNALHNLEWDNLLVIGSGFSFHNIRALFQPNNDDANAKNLAFDNWLRSTITDHALPEDSRNQRLVEWEEAPFARFCHPREEHLLPLHVCYGLAQKASDEAFELTILNKQSSMFLWER